MQSTAGRRFFLRVLVFFATTAMARPAKVLLPVPAPIPAPAAICPDQVPTTGIYRNHSYGFTVTLPAGAKGEWNSARCVADANLKDCVCMSDHGRDISLGPDAYITVYTGFIDATLASELLRDVEAFRGNVDDLDFSVRELRETKLEENPAYRYVAVKQVGELERYREAVIAETPGGGIEYFVVIEAPEKIYRLKRPLFLSLLRSWRTTPRD